MTTTKLSKALLVGFCAAFVAACSGDGGDAGSAGVTDASDAEPGTVIGTTLDTQGRPLANSVIWIRPAITTGVARTSTDADGRYKVEPLLELPYYAYAWAPIEYRDKRYCVRLAMPNPTDYDTFSGREAVVRDFRWQLTGKIGDTTFGPDEDGYYFGGTILAMLSFDDGDAYQARIELTLNPTGPLIDGSAGQTITRTADLSKPAGRFVLDIPVGAYDVQAVLIDKQDQRKPLFVGMASDQLAERTNLEFPASSSGCGGGDYGSGFSRAYLYVSDHPPEG